MAPTTVAPRRRLVLRMALAVGAGALAALGASAPASAHVEPTATVVPAGSAATVEFTVQHGCDGSPTTKVEFKVPDEIADALAVDKDGWTGSVADGVVTYEGGPLPADREDTFSVSFTAPATVGATLAFPFLQTCVEGSIDWIQLDEGAERPAPIIEIGDPDPNAPVPTTAVDGTPDATGAPTTTTVAEPTTTTIVVPGVDDEGSAADPSSGATVVIGVVALTAAGVGFAVWLRRRQAP